MTTMQEKTQQPSRFLYIWMCLIIFVVMSSCFLTLFWVEGIESKLPIQNTATPYITPTYQEER